jgi:hypothetical protein
MSLRVSLLRKLFLLPSVLLLTLPICPIRADFEVKGIDGSLPDPRFLTPEERASGFRPDERLQFRVGWGIFGKVAIIVVTTDMAPSEHGEHFHISSSAKTTGLIRAIYPANTQSDSFLDPSSWSILSSQFEGRIGSEDKKELTVIDYDRRLVIHEDYIQPEKSYTHPLPMAPVLDYISSILQIRGLPLEVGKSFPVFLHGGGKLYLVEVDIIGREIKRSVFGNRPSFVLAPRMQNPSGIFARGGGVTMWVTDDEHRLPIQVNVHLGFGTTLLILERYEAPGLELGKKRAR